MPASAAMTVSQAGVNTTIIVSGLPPGATVEFIPNNGVPVFALADASGTAKYLPLVEGSLEIIVMQNGIIIDRATVTVLPEIIPDKTPPAGVTDLHNTTFASNNIRWTWIDPGDADFDHVEVYVDNSFAINVSRGVQLFSAAGFTPDSQHTISTRTVDTNGNINLTWVNHTARTSSGMVISEARVNTTLIVSGLPPGADVQFILNGGVPVYAIADAAGTAWYLPLIEGRLEIIVMQNGAVIASATVTVLPEIPAANGIITGRVTNSSTGAAIPGSIVTAGSVTAITDATGSYSMSIAPGTYTVRAGKQGFVANTTIVPVTAGQIVTLDFALSPFTLVISEAKVNTTLIVSGLPPGATVEFILNNGVPVFSLADAIGTARYLPLMEGSLEIIVMQDGIIIKRATVTVLPEIIPDRTAPAGVTDLHNTTFTPNNIKWTWIDPGDADFDHVEVYIDSSFAINVSRGMQLFGAAGFAPDSQHTISTRTVDTNGNINLTWVNHTARTASGMVISEARVNTTLVVSSLPPGTTVEFILNNGVPVFALADASGAARYLPLMEGNLEIIVIQNGVIIQRATVTVLPEIPAANGTIAGTVTNASSGIAIAGAFVTAGSVTAITDAAGNYSISIAPGTYTVTASAPGFITQNVPGVTVSSGATTTRNFALTPFAMVISEARVNTTLVVSGLPSGADVQFILNGGTPVFVKADGAGTARYLPLLEGSLEIIVRQNGVIIATAMVTVLPEFPAANGTIAGTVTNASSGTAIAGATVTAGSVTVITDAAGNYSISIAPGTYAVTASAAGFITQNVPGVTVTSGATTTRNFALSPVIKPINVTIELRDNINPKAKGEIRVVILNNTPQGFNVVSINISTVKFGEAKVVKNGTEGNKNLLLHFNIEATGIECGDTQVILTGKTFSGQDIIGTANIVTVGCNAEVGKGGGKGGGGGGGGGVISSEPFENIEESERHEKAIIANTPVTYNFAIPEHGLDQIVITGSENENDIMVKVDFLKGTAKGVTASPPGTVYKNLNILAGTKRIKQAVIKFRVENTWMQNNNFDAGDLKMLRWDGSKWVQLETRETSNDGKYTRFEATTINFSNFAIAGLKPEVASPEVAITETPAKPTEPPVAAVPMPKAAGFEGILAIAAMCALYMLWRKRR